MNEAATPSAPSQPVTDSGLAAAMEAHIKYTEAQASGASEAPAQTDQKPTEMTSAAPEAQEQPQSPNSNQNAATAPEKKGKGMWEKLGKVTEPNPAEKPEAETEYPEEAPKEQNAWTKIKREVKELKALRTTWDTERAQYEARVKELAEKSSQFSDDDVQALKRFREDQAIFDVQRTDTYQNEAAKPWSEGNETLKNISEYTKIPADKFKDALLEPNPLMRNREITKVLKTAKMVDPHTGDELELDASEIASLATQISEAGKKLHDASAAHKRLTEEAALKGQQRATQEEASKIKAQQESKEVFKRGMTEMSSNMKVQLKDLMDDGLLDEKSFESISQEDLPTDLMDQIYALHASHLMIPLTQSLREARAKIAEYEADRQARLGARPSTKPIPTPGGNGKRPMTLQEAMRAQVAHGIG